MRAWAAGLALLFLADGAARAQTQPCAQTIAPKTVSGTSYTVSTTDRCGWILLTSGGSVTVSLPATGLIFAPNFQFTVLPVNGATVTFSNLPDPQTGLSRTVNLQSTLTLAGAQGAVVTVQQDMNWYALPTGKTEGSGSVTSLTATSPIVITPDPTTTTGDISHLDSGVTPGSYTNTSLTVDATGHITAAADGNGGTVTSVGLSGPGGLFGITGTNPITGSGTFGYTTTGTSGGIPYFSSGSVLSSSGTLSAHAVVIGGGLGAAPTGVTACAGVLAWPNIGADPACSATPTLGTPGIAASLSMTNATSGTVTLQPVTGALGTVTASLPANTGTIAELNLAQAWTAAQRGTPVNVAISTATFTPDFDGANHFEIDLTSACPCTLADPSTTPAPGQSGTFEIHQDVTGGRTITTWGSKYRYVGGTSAITLSSAGSAKDYLSYYVNTAGSIVFGAIVAAPAH